MAELTRDQFPHGFLFGAATAAYQVEGAATADGRVPSIWDTFCQRAGTIRGGDTGDVACDHYHRVEQDVAVMQQLGLDAYRFSMAWPRLLPEPGRPNPAGIAFYDRLLDTLLEAGIAPWVTLYHWDLPQSLQDAGGWPARDTAAHFADYAALAADAFGDRVAGWITVNEPWVAAFLGHSAGVHAPGQVDPPGAVRAAHHLRLGHGLALAAVRARDPRTPAGITLNLTPVEAAGGRSEFQDIVRRVDGMANRLFLEPVLAGDYPTDVLADLAPVCGTEHIQDGDLAVISAPIDFLGINYYFPTVVTGGDWPGTTAAAGGYGGRPRTDMGWEIDPAELTNALTRVSADYGEPPIYLTENGSAWPDRLEAGRVADPQRTAYLIAHLSACLDAIAAGVDLRGYFAWSLLDNFEWAEGYAKRFGLVYVDYPTQQRIVKDSGRWYAAFLRGEGGR